MRIYEGSPRQDWEEVLRSIGSFADHERMKELLLLELDAGFLLQGLALPKASAWTESEGILTKVTHELPDDEIGKLMDEAAARRTAEPPTTAHVEISNYYEQALRVVGAYIDAQKARDVFLLEQDGAFVLRILTSPSAASKTAHQLVEFTKEDIVAMIDAAPEQRG